VRKALAPGEPDQATLERIERRIRGVRQQPFHTRFVFRLVFISLFLFAGVASVKAYEMIRKAAWLHRDSTPALAPTPAPKLSHRRALRPGQPGTSDETALTVPPAAIPASAFRSDSISPAAAPPADREPHGKAKPIRREVSEMPGQPVAEAAPATLASPEPLGPPSGAFAPTRGLAPTPTSPSSPDEIAAIDRAMTLLRRDHNAEVALSALDAYLARYPNGVLNREARFGRVDALLMLRRSDDALRALESVPLDSHRRSTELQVIRGELRSQGNCAGAIADFGQALGHSPDAALLERILYGRAACLAKTGDSVGAASDLQRYLERFPQAPHAAWARRWLADHERPTENKR